MDEENINVLFQAERTDNGELIQGYYFPRPNLSKYYIVTTGSSVWYEVDPDTVRPV